MGDLMANRFFVVKVVLDLFVDLLRVYLLVIKTREGKKGKKKKGE